MACGVFNAKNREKICGGQGRGNPHAPVPDGTARVIAPFPVRQMFTPVASPPMPHPGAPVVISLEVELH